MKQAAARPCSASRSIIIMPRPGARRDQGNVALHLDQLKAEVAGVALERRHRALLEHAAHREVIRIVAEAALSSLIIFASQAMSRPFGVSTSGLISSSSRSSRRAIPAGARQSARPRARGPPEQLCQFG